MATNRWISALADVARAAIASVTRPGTRTGTAPAPRPGARPAPGPSGRHPAPGSTNGSAPRSATSAGPAVRGGYPGDFTGVLRAQYSPSLDGNPDPGEVVWTWVPYEEDFTQGKDRPVLLVGRDGDWLLGLMLTSKDHSRDSADETRHGRRWLDIGSGPWDSKGRESEVRLDRVVRVDPTAVRREGAVVDAALFTKVVRAAG